MASNGIDIDAKDYQKFYAAIKGVDVNVQKQLRKHIRAFAKPIVEEVKQKARELPSKNGESEGVGLREGIAKATELKINASKKGGFSVRIRVSGTKFNAATGKYRKLPRYVEGLSKSRKWRHPVFANAGDRNGTWKGAWVEQAPTPFLIDTVLAHKSQFKEEIAQSFIDAMKETKLVK